MTQEAAAQFAQLADRLRHDGTPPQEVAHFLIRCLFCLFAEDAGLLPDRLFTRIVTQARQRPQEFCAAAAAVISGDGDRRLLRRG